MSFEKNLLGVSLTAIETWFNAQDPAVNNPILDSNKELDAIDKAVFNMGTQIQDYKNRGVQGNDEEQDLVGALRTLESDLKGFFTKVEKGGSGIYPKGANSYLKGLSDLQSNLDNALHDYDRTPSPPGFSGGP